MATQTDNTEISSSTGDESKEVSNNDSCVSEERKENIDTNANGDVTEEIKNKIVSQIEYYFGNFNLPRDKFLIYQTKLDEGWVSLDTMVKFRRLADLSTNHEVIRKALKSSTLMEVDDEFDRIRRSPANPIPYFGEELKAETIKRTIYCKGFPRDGSVNLDVLLEHFKPYEPIENIHLRQFYDQKMKKSGFKGSILIVFPTVEKAQEFLDIDDVKFKGKPLIRKWQRDYLEEKTQEYNERQAKKQAKLQQKEKDSKSEQPDPPVNTVSELDAIPSGTFIFLSGFNPNTTRENIRAALAQYTDDVSFVDFNQGDPEAYVRLRTAYSNEDLIGKIKDNLKVDDADIAARVVEGDEEEEQIEKVREARSNTIARRRNKRKIGRGGFRGGRGGPFNKRRRK